VKKLVVAVVKIAISAAILIYLFRTAWNDKSFQDLYGQSKDWTLLACAAVTTLLAVALTFVRWHMLVRALGMDFSMKDAFRLGFLAYLFNFFSFGVVGGDVLKSVFIARQQPDNRAGAVASVVLDRIIGLAAMLMLGAFAFMFVNLDETSIRDPGKLETVRNACRGTVILTAISLTGLFLFMIPGLLQHRFWNRLAQLPLVGGIAWQLLESARVYQKRRRTLLYAIGMSIGVHVLNILSFYLVAVGLPGAEPSLATHFVIVPVAMVAGAIPLPGGLGALEYALDFLYRAVSTVEVAERQGFVVALGYRVVQMGIAAIGLGYYISGRTEVQKLIDNANEWEEAEVNTGQASDDESTSHVKVAARRC
jgi:uncharacterized membrane protein YbhN (UPF0104 family)